MRKEDMTCEKCIYSEPFATSEEPEFKGKIGADVVVCKLHPATQTKGKKSWCGQGNWQAIDKESGQWIVWSYGDFEPIVDK
jgi:hypothetical protein